MFVIGILLGCAASKNITTQSMPLEHSPVIETIDLSKEFGQEFTGWYYHLSLQDSQTGNDLNLPKNSGWAAISLTDHKLLGTGFFPSINPAVLCSSGCQLLSVYVSRSDQSLPVPFQEEQSLVESAPPKSSGLAMMETWNEPLNGLPVNNKSLRLRAVTLEPNGVVGQHKHQGRPSFAYILSGDVIEHRGNDNGPYTTGERVAERNGLVHWWENGDSSATIIVFDIIDAE